MAALLLLLITFTQPGGVILPVYRDLLKPAPFNEAAYADRCGWGAGPLELLRPSTS